jgi:hypothetical protein
MTMLSVIRTFCDRAGVPAPSFVAGATNAQTIQLLSLLNEVIEDLCERWVWQVLVKETTFTTIAAEDQGAMSTLAPSGFLSILNETIYNRTLRLPVYGPIAATKWQALKALPNAGPFYKYRIRGDRLLFNPTAAAGHTCAFEYKSSFAVLASDSTLKDAATLDDDTFVFPERLLLAGLRWKWRSEKGLDYAQELDRFETMALGMAGRDGSAMTLSQSEGNSEFRPGIFVPAGNWTVS